MAIDTVYKRRSAMTKFIWFMPPVPDGSLVLGDREQIAGFYSGIVYAPASDTLVNIIGSSASVARAYIADLSKSLLIEGDLEVKGNIYSGGILLSNTTPPTTLAGAIYFDGTHFQGYDGSSWKQLD